MQDRLLSLAEMAERLQRSPRQFRKDVRNRNIPHIRLGHKRLFDADKVLEYLTSTEIPIPTAPKRSKITPRIPNRATQSRFAERLGLVKQSANNVRA